MNLRLKLVSSVFLMIALISPALFAQTLDQAKVVAGADRAVEKAVKLYPATARMRGWYLSGESCL